MLAETQALAAERKLIDVSGVFRQLCLGAELGPPRTEGATKSTVKSAPKRAKDIGYRTRGGAWSVGRSGGASAGHSDRVGLREPFGVESVRGRKGR
ncbi:MAG: hypothetical protein M5U26_29055 [Planctomycetota bacterium]|nr:hypothetical protein [Planctomycetota bacterium]